MSRISAKTWAVALLAATLAQIAWADDEPQKVDIEGLVLPTKPPGAPKSKPPEQKFGDFNEVTKDSEKYEGLFTLYEKDDHLYAEIKPFQFDQPLLSPIAIAKGMAMAGSPLNFGDEWVLVFKRVGDRVQLVRRNVHYKAPSGTPLEKAVKLNYTDSVLMALPIDAINNSTQGVLVDLADVYLGDFGQLGLGSVDRSRSSIAKVKAFPNNIEIEIEATYSGYGYGSSGMMGDDGVVDGRGITLTVHYSLVKLNESGYRPRMADDRVGHFLSAVKDFGSDDPDTEFVRQINRWRLEKADPKAKVSAPRKQIVWWIEDTVPFEYRPAVEEGILEWNKAFEKAGFKNALAVRWQGEGLGDQFDPEDINYCTFRWITTPGTFAMSCLRADPITGEMIDGDVIFDASWIKYWKNEYALLSGTAPGSAGRAEAPPQRLMMGRVLSPIMAIKQGYGMPLPPSPRPGARPGDPAPTLTLGPAQWGGLQGMLRRRLATGRYANCQFNAAMGPELGLAALAAASRDDDDEDDEAKKDDDKDDKTKDDKTKDDKTKDDDKDVKKKDEPKLPDDLLGQMIKEVVMHEVGHSLGLRHNFHASTMLTNDQLHDTAITRTKGMVGSVMDYNPMNIAPKGKKQGDYTTTTIGPYDYWAIEYAYKTIDGDEEDGLKKIAERSPEPDLAYGTDDDFSNNDPLVNAYDLGADPCEFARDRVTLASELMKDLDVKVVKDGEAWTRARGVFSTLLNQWGNAAYIVSAHVGGQYVSRNHKADPKAKDPLVPVSGAKQREALAFVVDKILGDEAFRFSPALLRKLTTERWYHWGAESSRSSGESVDYPVLQEVLGIQKIVLGQCLSADTLTRLQNQELMSDEGAKPLKIAEVFRALTDGIWTECPAVAGDQPAASCSTIRRNLQRDYVKRLSTIVLGEKDDSYSSLYSYVYMFSSPPMPDDARSLARLHLKEIQDRVTKSLEKATDDTTKAHLDETRTRIAKVLDARVQANEP